MANLGELNPVHFYDGDIVHVNIKYKYGEIEPNFNPILLGVERNGRFITPDQI